MGDEASVRDVETTAYQADRDEGSGLLDLRKYSNAESMKAALKKKNERWRRPCHSSHRRCP